MTPELTFAGLVDLDLSFFFQLFIFLLFFVLARRLAFRPLLSLFEARKKAGADRREAAAESRLRTERLTSARLAVLAAEEKELSGRLAKARSETAAASASALVNMRNELSAKNAATLAGLLAEKAQREDEAAAAGAELAGAICDRLGGR